MAMETRERPPDPPAPTGGVIGFSLKAAAHLLRTADCATRLAAMLVEIRPLLDNGTIIFGHSDLPVRMDALLAEAASLDKEVSDASKGK